MTNNRLRLDSKFLLFLFLLFFLSAVPLAANESFEEVSTEEMLFVRGLISKVYPERMQISVRPPKGSSVRIRLDPETILEGVSRIDDFEKEQQVKVWYAPGDGDNRAIKIEKMMELGC